MREFHHTVQPCYVQVILVYYYYFSIFSSNWIYYFQIDSGSSVSHSFLLESKVKGLFHGTPAVIKFRVPSKAALQVCVQSCYSNFGALIPSR